MPHYAKCDVISRQNKIFKLKYLFKRTCIIALNTLSNFAIKIFVSWALKTNRSRTTYTYKRE